MRREGKDQEGGGRTKRKRGAPFASRPSLRVGRDSSPPLPLPLPHAAPRDPEVPGPICSPLRTEARGARGVRTRYKWPDRVGPQVEMKRRGRPAGSGRGEREGPVSGAGEGRGRDVRGPAVSAGLERASGSTVRLGDESDATTSAAKRSMPGAVEPATRASPRFEEAPECPDGSAPASPAAPTPTRAGLCRSTFRSEGRERPGPAPSSTRLSLAGPSDRDPFLKGCPISP